MVFDEIAVTDKQRTVKSKKYTVRAKYKYKIYLLSIMATSGKGRRAVLDLYRKIIRTGLKWRSKDVAEGDWILQEASKVFRENLHVKNTNKIEELVADGEERLTVAKWSNIPYARPVHMGGGGAEGLSGHKQAAQISKGRRRVNSSGKTVWKTNF